MSYFVSFRFNLGILLSFCSGLGCHYLHLHKGKCLTDQYLDGCYIFKPLANAVSLWFCLEFVTAFCILLYVS